MWPIKGLETDFYLIKPQVYSGGNDAIVIVHDLETLKPVDVFKHEEPVYGVSVHPADKNLFLTACSDGRVLLHDMRSFRKLNCNKY